jgi:antitoxin MazE
MVKYTVTKWGNSLGIRIPKPLAKKLKLKEGTPIEMDLKDDSIVIRRKRYDLETLLSQITPDNLHDEVSTGKPVGHEVW